MNRLAKEIEQAIERSSDRQIPIITLSAPDLCSESYKLIQTAYLAELTEQFLMTLKGILSNISSVLAHVNFNYHFFSL